MNPFEKLKSTHQQRVEMFMAKAGQNVPAKPTLPDEPTRFLRAKLTLEEAIETINALGYAVKVTAPGVYGLDKMFEPNLEEIVDGCADSIVIATGTLSACGVSDVAIQDEVDNNNLSKFAPGSYRREDGKWIKPPTWTPPKIKEILVGQGGVFEEVK